MPDFWLGTYKLDRRYERAESMAEPLLSTDVEQLAVEVIRGQDGELAVLFSYPDQLPEPGELECRIGFANGAKACNRWRERGFPLVDADIRYDGGGCLTIRSPFFGKPGAMAYGELLVEITGVTFGGGGVATTPAPLYHQQETAPDSAWPATVVRRRPVAWRASRSRVSSAGPTSLTMKVTDARSPSLNPLTNTQYQMAGAWTGELVLPSKSHSRGPSAAAASREDTFGVPAFRFQDVEALGFRIDLPRDAATDGLLEELIRPLNFHLELPDGMSVPDFRYKPASRTLIVELLRYGRMRLATQQAPLTPFDYQSQHELVVRLLVGRVDDDARHARDPAVFVPAIFVDNPWSKILGRDVQGFPKCLADFCFEDEDKGGMRALKPDGSDAAGGLRPLARVSRIGLVRRAGAAPDPADLLLELECAPERSVNWDEFEDMSVGAALTKLSLSEMRWRREDFERLEYLGSFMRTAIRQLLFGFRSVQASPVGAQDLDKAWITGKFSVDELVRVAFPTGSARLAFHAPAGAPSGWERVCKLLAFRTTHDFHMGSWYRLKFSMNMAIDDGLEWSD